MGKTMPAVAVAPPAAAKNAVNQIVRGYARAAVGRLHQYCKGSLSDFSPTSF